MQETWVWSLAPEDLMKKGMATHSSIHILAWRIPWTEEPGGLQFMGSQRVRHYWTSNSFFHLGERGKEGTFSCICCFLLLLLLSHFSRVRLCGPIDGSPPGFPVPRILQARTLEWVAISLSNAWKWEVKVKSLSHVRLLATPWTAAHQAPPSMGFSRQEYWSGMPLPSLFLSCLQLKIILMLKWDTLIPFTVVCILSLMINTVCFLFKNSFPTLKSWRCSFIVSSTVLVLSLIFKSLFHLKLFFLCMMRDKGSISSLLIRTTSYLSLFCWISILSSVIWMTSLSHAEYSYMGVCVSEFSVIVHWSLYQIYIINITALFEFVPQNQF